MAFFNAPLPTTQGAPGQVRDTMRRYPAREGRRMPFFTSNPTAAAAPRLLRAQAPQQAAVTAQPRLLRALPTPGQPPNGGMVTSPEIPPPWVDPTLPRSPGLLQPPVTSPEVPPPWVDPTLPRSPGLLQPPPQWWDPLDLPPEYFRDPPGIRPPQKIGGPRPILRPAEVAPMSPTQAMSASAPIQSRSGVEQRIAQAKQQQQMR